MGRRDIADVESALAVVAESRGVIGGSEGPGEAPLAAVADVGLALAAVLGSLALRARFPNRVTAIEVLRSGFLVELYAMLEIATDVPVSHFSHPIALLAAT